MSCTLSSGIGFHKLVDISYQSSTAENLGKVERTIGSTFNVTCIANCSSNENLTVVDVYPVPLDAHDKGVALSEKDSGVVVIGEMEESSDSASKMLQLQASVINGTKRSTPFKCAAKVRLPDGDEFIRYGDVFPSGNFSSEFHLPSLAQSVYLFV